LHKILYESNKKISLNKRTQKKGAAYQQHPKVILFPTGIAGGIHTCKSIISKSEIASKRIYPQSKRTTGIIYYRR
jgi:hypothetical protein